MPRQHDVRIAPEASKNLDAIYTFIAQQSPQNAAVVLERLLDGIFSLKFLPHRYKVHWRGKDRQDTVRSMPLPPFVVYYRIVEERHLVRVLTVRHGRQRRPRTF